MDRQNVSFVGSLTHRNIMWSSKRFVHHATGLLVAALMTAAAIAQTPPNIVLIISDDQAWTDYGFMGHANVQTPNLDRLATESLTFTRGYVPSSLCRPSLASIISGLYPHQHRIVGNDPAPLPGLTAAQSRRAAEYLKKRGELIAHLDEIPTLPKLLGAAGYLSHQSGKWWEGNYRRGGFTHGMTRGFPEPGGRHGDDGLAIGREGLEPIFEFVRESQANQKPFFVWYAPFLPHTPHTPPARLLDRYRSQTSSLPIAKYWAMCEWFDETCGELLNFLDEQELRDDTMVVYVTDNGWINRADRSAYAPRSKRSPYEGGIRTPIMIRYPGHAAARIDDSTVVSSLDLAPTILRACGLEPPEEMSGVNLLDAAAVAARSSIYGDVLEHDVVDVADPAASLRYRWTIEMPWKLIVPDSDRLPDESVELYQLVDDPNERDNRASTETATRDRLLQQLNNWWSP